MFWNQEHGSGSLSPCAAAHTQTHALFSGWRFSPAPFVCSRGAQRVLRSGDMEYVMLHLIFSLPQHAWGGITCSVRCLRSVIPENSSGGSLSAPKTICFRQADLRSRPCHANILMLCLVFAAAGPGMPGAGDISSMDPTMAYGAAPNMLLFAPDGGAGFDLGGSGLIR